MDQTWTVDGLLTLARAGALPDVTAWTTVHNGTSTYHLDPDCPYTALSAAVPSPLADVAEDFAGILGRPSQCSHCVLHKVSGSIAGQLLLGTRDYVSESWLDLAIAALPDAGQMTDLNQYETLLAVRNIAPMCVDHARYAVAKQDLLDRTEALLARGRDNGLERRYRWKLASEGARNSDRDWFWFDKLPDPPNQDAIKKLSDFAWWNTTGRHGPPQACPAPLRDLDAAADEYLARKVWVTAYPKTSYTQNLFAGADLVVAIPAEDGSPTRRRRMLVRSPLTQSLLHAVGISDSDMETRWLGPDAGYTPEEILSGLRLGAAAESLSDLGDLVAAGHAVGL